jgi:NAD(P)-dependent dehydrogenase (short-subunit alcohol dehydrogenase family)
MKTNVGSALSTLNHLNDLVRHDGVVSVMSSGLGSISNNTAGGWEPYRSSKAALNQSLCSFAAEHSDMPWSLTAVAPGWVRTDMGGQDAPLDVETSTNGIATMLEGRMGKRGIAFMNYQGDVLPW